MAWCLGDITYFSKVVWWFTELHSQWACESVRSAYRHLDCKVRRVAAGSNLNEVIIATVVSRVLFLTLISFPNNTAKRAVGESRAEVFFVKKNKSNLLFSQRSALGFWLYVFPCFLIFKDEMNFFPLEQPGEENEREKSLCIEYKLSGNSNSVTETQIKIVPECLIS